MFMVKMMIWLMSLQYELYIYFLLF